MTTKIIVITSLFLMFLMLVFLTVIIILKKQIYGKYVDASEKVTIFDYISDYNSSWITRQIDYKGIISENNQDLWLIKSVKRIKILQYVVIGLLFEFVISIVVVKYFGLA